MTKLEIGDMILWRSDLISSSANLPDTGWVVYVETRHRNGHDPQEYVVVHWLSSDTPEEHWVGWLLNQNCQIIKGDKDDR